MGLRKKNLCGLNRKDGHNLPGAPCGVGDEVFVVYDYRAKGAIVTKVVEAKTGEWYVTAAIKKCLKSYSLEIGPLDLYISLRLKKHKKRFVWQQGIYDNEEEAQAAADYEFKQKFLWSKYKEGEVPF